jgi:hypothetical protein
LALLEVAVAPAFFTYLSNQVSFSQIEPKS